MKVHSSTAIVTGANGGIGSALVEGLLNGGASKVYAGVRCLKNADEIVKSHGKQVIPLELNLSESSTLEKAAEQSGDVDLVINCGGILHTADALSNNAVEMLEREIDVNVKGLLRLAHAYSPILKENGGGVLVQINSVSSIKCFPKFATYSASKAAAYSITQALRAELFSQGTRVISVHPGPIATRMSEIAGFSEGAAPASIVSDAILDAIESRAFHVFPDRTAKQLWSAYEWYAQAAIEAN